MTHSTTEHCVVDPCIAHIPDCAGEGCSCPPELAAADSRVCAWHETRTREQLRELPALWEAIAEPSTGGRGGTSTDDAPYVAGDTGSAELGAPIETRHLIRTQLLSWLQVLHEAPDLPGLRLPADEDIVKATRALVVRHQSDAEVALQAYRAAGRAPKDETPAEAEARALRRAQHYDRAVRARAAADGERAQRQTGRDILEVHAERLDRHLLWLLASVHAKVFAEDIADLHARARPLAYRGGRPSITVLHDCGARVMFDPDAAYIRCRGCGEWGDPAWWKAQVAPAAGPLSLRDLADWFVIRAEATGEPVPTYEQLRNWTRAERVGQRIFPVNPGKAKLLYDPEAVALIAAARLGRRTST